MIIIRNKRSPNFGAPEKIPLLCRAIIQLISSGIACASYRSCQPQVYYRYAGTQVDASSRVYVYACIQFYRGSFRFISSATPDERTNERTARRTRCPTFSVARTRQCIPQVPVNRFPARYIPVSDSRREIGQNRCEPRRTRMHRRCDDVSGSEGFFSRHCHRRRRSPQVRRTVRSRSNDRTWAECTP